MNRTVRKTRRVADGNSTVEAAGSNKGREKVSAESLARALRFTSATALSLFGVLLFTNCPPSPSPVPVATLVEFKTDIPRAGRMGRRMAGRLIALGVRAARDGDGGLAQHHRGSARRGDGTARLRGGPERSVQATRDIALTSVAYDTFHTPVNGLSRPDRCGLSATRD